VKPIYVLLIAVATGVVGAGIGLFLGGKIYSTLGLAGGASYGVCVTTETAKQAGMLTQPEIDRLIKRIQERAGSDFNLSPERIAEFAQINCPDILQKVKSAPK
jgi:heme O synthase-like polyprenyltransferase